MTEARRANPISDCPLTAAAAATGGKWKLIIVYWLAESPRQFGELCRLLPSISSKVLTEYGRSVVPIVEAVRHWGRGHIERFDGAAAQ